LSSYQLLLHELLPYPSSKLSLTSEKCVMGRLLLHEY
jgi:hypothetical protein